MSERQVEFPRGEPVYWFAEFDVEAKVLEIRLGKYSVRIPQETVLSWMMIGEIQKREKKRNEATRAPRP